MEQLKAANRVQSGLRHLQLHAWREGEGSGPCFLFETSTQQACMDCFKSNMFQLYLDEEADDTQGSANHHTSDKSIFSNRSFFKRKKRLAMDKQTFTNTVLTGDGGGTSSVKSSYYSCSPFTWLLQHMLLSLEGRSALLLQDILKVKPTSDSSNSSIAFLRSKNNIYLANAVESCLSFLTITRVSAL
ncbi:hypothetical protein AGDE_12988 [Angomonas deanei]|nr:hypothetical protein AGDE_12988 [Angomonas deanei]|eukprot:EPY23187.1 hypothetical protein AGDE_12988 [Angomonas deanei]